MDEKILVLDEPTAGQDLRGIQLLEKILEELQKKGTTVITITHDMEFVVNNFPKVFVMAHKNLLKVGASEEIFQDDELLTESMLKKPYISSLSAALGIKGNIISQEEFIKCFVK